MKQVELRAESRQVTGKKVRHLRSEALVPAVMYGPDTPATQIQANEREMARILAQAGETALINVFVDNDPNPTMVLARDVQRDVLSGNLLHVDFYQVRLTEMVRTTPRLEFVGEAPVIHTENAVVIHNMTSIEIECLPTDLVDTIRVDLSGLTSLEDGIYVRDLPVPPGARVLADPEDVVVAVVASRSFEEEEEAMAEAEALAEFEEEDLEEAPEED
jgi:large subunit ribosomal protein L25